MAGCFHPGLHEAVRGGAAPGAAPITRARASHRTGEWENDGSVLPKPPRSKATDNKVPAQADSDRCCHVAAPPRRSVRVPHSSVRGPGAVLGYLSAPTSHLHRVNLQPWHMRAYIPAGTAAVLLTKLPQPLEHRDSGAQALGLWLAALVNM